MWAATAEVGAPAPAFELPRVGPDGASGVVRLGDYRGGWVVLLFYPSGLTCMCPTELRRFSTLVPEFERRDCQVVGVGVGALDIHRHWVARAASDGGLGPVQFPLAADASGAVARAYGIRPRAAGPAGRGLYIVDPTGVLQYQVAHAARVCRSAEETLRVLDALQSGGRCAASFTLGDGTIDPAERLEAGRAIGHYQVLRKLGEGGFGQVFQAWDHWLHRMVAVKVARPGSRPELHRIVAEARPAAALSHPNVCTLYAVEVHEGLPVIAMEWLRGEPLSGRLHRGPLDPAEAGPIVRQIACGLGAAHAARIVHGDVKPGNVMLCDDGVAKVLDFGLGYCSPRHPLSRARTLLGPRTGRGRSEPPTAGDDPGACARTPTHSACAAAADEAARRRPIFRGTPQYLSPEHGREQPVEPASDVFALGLVIYELLVGRRAIPTRTVQHAMRIVRRSDLRALARELPQPFRGIVHGCLAPHPADRITMATIAALLDLGHADRGA